MLKSLDEVVSISQMLPGNVQGTGQGGDRCEPTCAAIIDCTYKLGPSAKAGEAPEQVMQDIARWRNGGALSGPPEGPWLGDWLVSISNGAVSLQAIPSTPEAIDAAISAGNMIYAGVDDYGQQRLEDGSDPYQWAETEHAGHVEIISGFRDTPFAPLLHDPLRGTAGQPALYSWQSLLNAGLHLYRVVGPALPVTVTGGSMQPSGPFYKVTTGQNGVPTEGNAIAAAVGLTWQEIVAIPGQDASLPNYDPTGPYMVGFSLLLPGFPPPAPPVDTTLQQRLDEAVAQLAAKQQELDLLKAQEPSDPVALQQRQVAAFEAMAQDVHELTRLIPPSAPKLP